MAGREEDGRQLWVYPRPSAAWREYPARRVREQPGQAAAAKEGDHPEEERRAARTGPARLVVGPFQRAGKSEPLDPQDVGVGIYARQRGVARKA